MVMDYDVIGRKNVVAGVDIGVTGTRVGLVDSEGSVLFNEEFDTREYPEFGEYVLKLEGTIRNLMHGKDSELNLVGIGIGAPNGNSIDGTIEWSPNLPWREDKLQLTELIKEMFPDVPVSLSNDANAIAIGEIEFGNAKKIKDFIELCMGTGTGGGFVANGEIVNGKYGNAGEFGHMIVVPNGRDCGCGRRGCLEAYVSAPGLVRTVKTLLAERMSDSCFRSKIDFTAEDVYAEAKRGDMIAREAFELAGKRLGEALANIVLITGPEVIFIYGGLSKAGNLLIDPARKSLEDNTMRVFKNKTRIEISALREEKTVLGGAALIWRQLKKEIKVQRQRDVEEVFLKKISM